MGNMVFKILFLLLISINCFSQILYSKDGVSLGEKSIIVQSCIAGGNTELTEINGLKIDFKDYCKCFAESVIPNYNYNEIIDAVNSNNLKGLIQSEKGFDLVMECLNLTNVNYNNEFNWGSSKKYKEEWLRQITANCFESFESSLDVSKDWTIVFCNCYSEKIITGKYSQIEIEESDENSAFFKEVIMYCSNKANKTESL